MSPPDAWPKLVLTIDDLGCRRGGREVLQGLSLTAKSGELWAIRGENGAGKSTLLRLIAGLLTPSGGRIDLDGRPDPDVPIAEFCHYVGHLDALKPAMSVRETLDFWQAICGAGRRTPEDALDAFAIAHLIDLPTGYLSAGQRRRVGLARLLISDRPIWLLDEPTSALDRASEGRLGEVLEDHLLEGGMILAATHLDLPVSAERLKEFAVTRSQRHRSDEDFWAAEAGP